MRLSVPFIAISLTFLLAAFTSNTHSSMTASGPITANNVTVSGSVEVSSLTISSATFYLLQASSGSVSSSALLGTTTNDNAPAGRIGEYISSFQSTPVDFPSGWAYGDLTSINLTAGDWDVTGLVAVLPITGATSMTATYCGISNTPGDGVGVGGTLGDNLFNSYSSTPGLATGTQCVILNYRVLTTGTTTFYLKYRADWSGDPATAQGKISARRVR